MWIIINDEFGSKRYVNLDHLIDFYFDGQKTNIWVTQNGVIRATGDITRNLVDVIRNATNASFKIVGAENG